MRNFPPLSTLVLTLAFACTTYAQDFSNKGKDFWVGYGYHERMTAGNGGSQSMVLYFATETVTNVTVTIPGTGYARNYSIPANTIFTSDPIPKTGSQDARLNTEGISNKGIHITSDKPIVAYAHIYNLSVSGATLLFPTNTLGKEYYSVNYDQFSNSANANCWFYAVAVEPGITTVEITPSANTLTHVVGQPFTVDLTQGQVINIMGELGDLVGDLYTGVDLTGSKIRTISTGNEGCKRIAVFSGSGRIALVCNGVGTGQKSSDNYMVQAFPKNAWGKNYLTIPTHSLENNVYRIAVEDPTTVVRVNGSVLSGLINGFYYQVGPSNIPNRIESDKPIMVAQYISTSRYCGNSSSGDLGDPEVIYLSPIEQTVNRVILNSTPNHAIRNHYVNITIPNGGTSISSFRLDGGPQAPNFTPHPQRPAYSFARLSVSPGQHILQSDSGFNAIAYGYGDFESYGYNAGANVKDLYQFVSVSNEYATIDFPAACKGAPFFLSMTFPYQPTEIIWRFNGLFPDVEIPNPAYSETSVVNGRTLFKYKLPGSFTISSTGVHPIKVIAQNPTADGCSGIQEIDYELQVYDLPVANFDFTTNGCISSPVVFKGTSNNTSNRPVSHWYWNLGDGNSVNDKTELNHTYTRAGNYNVKYTVITDVGCKADTAVKVVSLNDPPVAGFTIATPYCAGKEIIFKDASNARGGAAITKWNWNFGDGSAVVTATANAEQTHTFADPGSYTVTLLVETNMGCQSTLFTKTVTVSPNPVVDFNLPNVCLPAGIAQFNSLSAISDGTENNFQYSWNFGDASPLINTKDPVHRFQGVGPYTVALTVTSNNGCATTLAKSLNTIYPEPQAAFSSPAEVCLGTAVNFLDQSTATGSSISQWSWNFGDQTVSTDKNPVKTYTTPGVYTVSLSVSSVFGCETVNKNATRTVIVNDLPTPGFSTSLPGCIDKEIVFTNSSVANSGNIIKWHWNFGDGKTSELMTGNSFSHTYPAVNNYIVSLQVETDKGCTSVPIDKNVVINPKPLAAFSSPEVCVTDASVFIDASSISTGSINGWEWNFGDANATATNPNGSTLQAPTHRYTLPGSYTAQLIARSSEGCKDTIQQTFTVNGAILTPKFTVENGLTICSNKEATIKDASQVDAGNIIRVEIFWDANDLSITTIDTDPTPGKTYSHKYPEFGTPATRTYRIRYDVYSGIVCVNSYFQDIVLLATPLLSFGELDPVCSNAVSFQITQAQLQNVLAGQGVYSGAGISAAGVFDPNNAGMGSHLITYTYSASNGCVNSVSQSIVVNPTPVADAGPDKTVLEGGNVTLTPALINNIPVTYNWTPADWLNDPAIANAVASPTTDMTYTLRIISDKGCSTNDAVFVKLLKSPVIPNIFSPNGDGIHDKWVIGFLESYPGCVVQIYNRYGQLVYRIINYTTPWDGKINGRDAPIGTYYYVIDPKNGKKPITGFVDIIR